MAIIGGNTSNVTFENTSTGEVFEMGSVRAIDIEQGQMSRDRMSAGTASFLESHMAEHTRLRTYQKELIHKMFFSGPNIDKHFKSVKMGEPKNNRQAARLLTK